MTTRPIDKQYYDQLYVLLRGVATCVVIAGIVVAAVPVCAKHIDAADAITTLRAA
jgi:hypothetical protein